MFLVFSSLQQLKLPHAKNKANVIRGVVLLSSLKRVVTPVVSKRAPLTLVAKRWIAGLG